MGAYLDCRYSGFRKMLEWAETCEEEVTLEMIDGTGWSYARESNGQLYNFLLTVTKLEAQAMINNMDPTMGYECWRKIAQFYDPPGGQGELDKINVLLNTTRCTTLAKVVSTVETWEKDWNHYVEKTREVLPEKWKVNLLLRMIPKNFAQDIRLRYVHDIKSIQYNKLREQVFHYCSTNTSGHSAMHIGALGDNEEEDLDLLKKGISKGRFEGNCNYCQKPGHKARENGQDVCRLLIADRKKGIDIIFPKAGGLARPKPKAKTKAVAKKGRGRSAAALEEREDDEEEQPEDDGDLECGMFQEEDDMDVCMLCDEDNDEDDAEESLCTLSFSYCTRPTHSLAPQRAAPTAATSTYSSANVVLQFVDPVRSRDEQETDREMQMYIGQKSLNTDSDELETITYMTDMSENSKGTVSPDERMIRGRVGYEHPNPFAALSDDHEQSPLGNTSSLPSISSPSLMSPESVSPSTRVTGVWTPTPKKQTERSEIHSDSASPMRSRLTPTTLEGKFLAEIEEIQLRNSRPASAPAPSPPGLGSHQVWTEEEKEETAPAEESVSSKSVRDEFNLDHKLDQINDIVEQIRVGTQPSTSARTAATSDEIVTQIEQELHSSSGEVRRMVEKFESGNIVNGSDEISEMNMATLMRSRLTPTEFEKVDDDDGIKQGSSVGDLDMIDEGDCNIYDDYNATHHYIDRKQQKALFPEADVFGESRRSRRRRRARQAGTDKSEVAPSGPNGSVADNHAEEWRYQKDTIFPPSNV